MSEVRKAVPFFDTNMHRVLHRVFLGPDVPDATAKPQEVMDLAAGLVPPGRGWAWNQAVMEFGALRCTARRPACEGCPLHDHCKARPKMARALAAAPRAKRNGAGPRYDETNIYLRGRVLARLREAPAPGVTLPDLARQIGGDTDVEPRRLSEVVEGLERDGLARVAEAPHRPEAHPAGAVPRSGRPTWSGRKGETPPRSGSPCRRTYRPRHTPPAVN